MTSQHLVSVIIIFLNSEKFLREAIESVFAQTYGNWELLLVDDGSTDASTAIARHCAAQHSPKVSYLEHAGHQNKGACAARNLGVYQAKGKYIALLDSDDVWLPQKLERQVALLESQPQAAMLYGASQYWHSWTGNVEDMGRDHVPDLGVSSDTLYNPPSLCMLLYPLGTGAAPCPSDLLIRRDAIIQIGGFEEDFRGERQLYEDQAFLAKMYLEHPVFVSSECWDRYRIRQDSCVSVVTKAGQYQSVRLFFLTWLEAYLLKRGVKDARIWGALSQAITPYRQPVIPDNLPSSIKQMVLRESTWSLRVSGGNVARLVFPPDQSDLVRVNIQKAQTASRFDIQLNQPRLRVEAAHSYLLRFRARADSPRTISAGFAKAEAPWSGLGLYTTIELTTEWKSFEEEFVALSDEDNARILFDMGNSPIPVELSSVSLRSMPDGQYITPDLSLAETREMGRHQTSLEGSSSTRPTLVQEQEPVGRQAEKQAAVIEGTHIGVLRRLTPFSRDWGWDRGLPIDRYYIETFLAREADSIRGRVLEIGDNSYTVRFGGDRVIKSDVLHMEEGNPKATIVGDLSSAPHILSETFDCIIITQTLNRIFEIREAINTLQRILRPNGVVLATFPGITQIDRRESAPWYWSLTTCSARNLFEERFPAAAVVVTSYGNVLAASSFLYGIAAEELNQREELDYQDPAYEVLITTKAVKSAPCI